MHTISLCLFLVVLAGLLISPVIAGNSSWDTRAGTCGLWTVGTDPRRVTWMGPALTAGNNTGWQNNFVNYCIGSTVGPCTDCIYFYADGNSVEYWRASVLGNSTPPPPDPPSCTVSVLPATSVLNETVFANWSCTGSPDHVRWWFLDDEDDVYVDTGELPTASGHVDLFYPAGEWTYLFQAENGAGFDNESGGFTIIEGVNWTLVPTPTVTPFPVLPTVWPTLPEILNRTEFRDAIEENSTIGNLTAPYLDFIDGMFGETETFLSGVENVSLTPLTMITNFAVNATTMADDIATPLASQAVVISWMFGEMFTLIPGKVWAVINFRLILEILKAVMET